MSVVDSAPPSSPLELTDSEDTLFKMRDEEKVPATVTVPGSSNFALTLFDIVATGTVKPSIPGMFTLTLYGMDKKDVAQGASEASAWLPLATSESEPIGGAGELKETMWMIRGKDLLIFPGSGKLQGTFDSNIASHPIAALDLDEHPGDITDTDPLYIFAVGASFSPSDEEGQDTPPRRTGREAEETVLCTVELKSFTMNA